MNKEQESLNVMLTHLKLPNLPKKYEEGNEKVWTQGIVKMLRRSGTCDYVWAEHDVYAQEEVKVKKEIPDVGQPVKVVAIYPFEYLTEQDTPKFSSKEEIVYFLSKRTAEDEQTLSAMSNKNLRKLLNYILIKEKLSKWTGRIKGEVEFEKNLQEQSEELSIDSPSNQEADDVEEPDEVDMSLDDKKEEDSVLGEEPKKRGRKPKV